MSSSEIQRINAPSYISKESLKKVLENGLKTSNLRIENYDISLASAGGENYTSCIYRVEVNYKTPDGKPSKVSLIFKEVETGGVMEKKNFINTENLMYLEMIPAMESLIGNDTMMAAKCFDLLQSERLFVLQDLKSIGYEVSDRINGINENECEIALKKIGQFHAASMVLRETKKETLKCFNKSFFSEDCTESQFLKELIGANLNHLIKIIDTWPDYEVITEKLKKLSPNFYEKCSELLKLQSNPLNVLNHGDLWVNNFMIKYDANHKPYDVLFFDFQLSIYGTLGIDIHYFLNTSPQLEVLKTKRYDLLKVYYHSLRSTLEMLQYSPIPSWDDVKNEIRRTELYGFITSATILPLISMDRSKSTDNNFESITYGDIAEKKRDIMYSAKRIIETMKYSLNRFDELDVFN